MKIVDNYKEQRGINNDLDQFQPDNVFNLDQSATHERVE